ncbi:unnamed protein product, partial [marine sediment metagenome]
AFASVEVVDIGPKLEIETVLSQDLIISDFQNFVLFDTQTESIFIDERALTNCAVAIRTKNTKSKSPRPKGGKVDYLNSINLDTLNDYEKLRASFDFSFNKLLKQS